jgi:hypothetical protein
MYQFHDYFGLEQASAGTGVVFVSRGPPRLLCKLTVAGYLYRWIGVSHSSQCVAARQVRKKMGNVHTQYSRLVCQLGLTSVC